MAEEMKTGVVRYEQTYGRRKANIWSAKAYYKPSLGHLVVRHPGVLRKSDTVRDINRIMREKKPASLCKGTEVDPTTGKRIPKSWKDFKSCLREKLKSFLSEAGYPKVKGAAPAAGASAG